MLCWTFWSSLDFPTSFLRERTSGPVAEDQIDLEKETLVSPHNSALRIIGAHVHIAEEGAHDLLLDLCTDPSYWIPLNVFFSMNCSHVIHQLTLCGRTLITVLLCCRWPPALDGLRSCIGLLRRFSNRYVCSLRAGGLMGEICCIPFTNNPFTVYWRTSTPSPGCLRWSSDGLQWVYSITEGKRLNNYGKQDWPA